MAYHSKYTGAEVDALLDKVNNGESGGSVTVDSSLSTTSENPVQNKVVTGELNKKADKEEVTAALNTKADKNETDTKLAELSSEIDGIPDIISIKRPTNIAESLTASNFDYNPDGCTIDGKATSFVITPPTNSNFIIGLNIGKLVVGHTYEFSIRLNASLSATHLTKGTADGSSGTGVATMIRTTEADGTLVDSITVKIVDAENHYFRLKGKWGSNLVLSDIYIKDVDAKEEVVLNFPNNSIKDNAIESISSSKINGGIRIDLLPLEIKDTWIRYSDGLSFLTGSKFSAYKVSVAALTKIEAFVYLTDSAAAAIAFFTENGTYLKDDSIQGDATGAMGKLFTALVPSEASYAIVTSNYGLSNDHKIYSYDGTNNIFFRLAELESLSEKDAPLYGDMVLNRLGDIYHLGMSATSSRENMNSVPSQSIFDIRCAKKMGYKVIEANLHITADGKYVTTHGQNGMLGHDFDDLNGNDAYGVVINDTTLADLQANYRYHTDIAEYRVPITTLEEFCAEAKKCGLVVMLQYRDKISLEIARSIMGDNMLYMYNAPRIEYKGAIMEYLGYSTLDKILARCEEVGKPYIYCMANPYSFDDATLKNIFGELHKRGFYVSSAYVPQHFALHLKGLGLDHVSVDGVAPYLMENQSVVDDKILTFAEDGTLTWKSLDL